MAGWTRLIVAVLLLTACAADEDLQAGPRLVSEVTLPASWDQVASAAGTPVRLTPEYVSPLNSNADMARYLIETPMPPPTITPTITPSITPPPPTATPTVTATATAPQYPTRVDADATRQIARPNDTICDSNWFFLDPTPAACPLAPPLSGQGVYQRFQNGYMLWVQSQDAIYVLYGDARAPRWEVFRDYFNDGMTEAVSADELQPPDANLWQPRRGFGLLWRSDEAIRSRIGWSVQQWEQPYSVQVQLSGDGAMFISSPHLEVFTLMPGGLTWNRYSGYDFTRSNS